MYTQGGDFYDFFFFLLVGYYVSLNFYRLFKLMKVCLRVTKRNNNTYFEKKENKKIKLKFTFSFLYLKITKFFPE